MSLETKPETKKHEALSSQAQSLARKYQETKELLQLQELKKRDMQAQLGLSLCPEEAHFPGAEILPSSFLTKTVTLTLTDSEDSICHFTQLLDCGRPLLIQELIELLHSHTISHKVLQNRQELENETMRLTKSLAKAGDRIQEYEARLRGMEDILGRTPILEPLGGIRHQEELGRDLSQRLELLTGENEALNQRCQEMVNQLREADREIDRLKAEIRKVQTGQTRAEQETTKDLKSFYEGELNKKTLSLEEALNQLEMLGKSLKETEKKLQLKEATLQGLGFQEERSETRQEIEQLRSYLKVVEDKLLEKETMLRSAEEIQNELQAQNAELQRKSLEVERSFKQSIVDNEEGKRRSDKRGEVSVEQDEHWESTESEKSAERRVEEVLKEFKRRSEVLNEVSDLLKVGGKELEQGSVTGMRTGLAEQELMNQFLDELQSKQVEEGDKNRLLDVVKRMRMENEIFDCLMKLQAEPSNKNSEETKVQEKCSPIIIEELAKTLRNKAVILERLSSTRTEHVMEMLQTLPSNRLQEGWWGVRNTIFEVAWMYKLLRQEHQVATVVCPSCAPLRRQNDELRTQLDQTQGVVNNLESDRDIQIEPLDKVKHFQDMDAKQKKELHDLRKAFEEETTKLKLEVTRAGETMRLRSEENVREIDSLTTCMENLKRNHEQERVTLLECFDREIKELCGVLEPLGDLPDDAQTSPGFLRQQIERLVTQEMKKRRDRDEAVSAIRMKYDRDLENLKVRVFRSFLLPSPASLLEPLSSC